MDKELKKKIDSLLKEVKTLTEMAYARHKWIDMLRDDFLGGSFGEYTKQYIAIKLGLTPYWENEVKRLLNNVRNHVSRKNKKTKFNTDKAIIEAVVEAAYDGSQVTHAKNQMIDENPEFRKKIKMLKIDEPTVFKEMIRKYLPEFKIYLKHI